jgi:prolyl-tRNA synthetase
MVEKEPTTKDTTDTKGKNRDKDRIFYSGADPEGIQNLWGFLKNMRYHDLKIETQRQAPSNARTEGFAFLVRAGYITRDGDPSLLGEQALARLQEAAKGSADLFAELGLPVIQSEANEIFFSIPTGSVEILLCPSCGYSARRETAKFKKQALPSEPALPIEKVPTPECNTIEALANFLNIPKEKTAKALMYTRTSDGKFVFAAVRGDMQLSEAKLKKLVGEVRLATADEIAKSGAAAGYASPIGLKNTLIVVDDLIKQSVNLVAGANEAGFHLKNTNYGRDYKAKITADIVMASAGSSCPNCGKELIANQAEILKDENGFWFEDLLDAIAEVHHDDKGLTLPVSGAPFDVYLMQLPGKQVDTQAKAEEIYTSLQGEGIRVLIDDRAERAGVKFNDADLIGCPIRITVGEKNLKEGMVELKPRKSNKNELVLPAELAHTIQSLLKTTK